MLRNEKILLTGPTSQVGFPIACALAKTNEVYGLARFANPADRERLTAVGVRCLQGDLGKEDLQGVPTDCTYVLNFAVAKSFVADFENDLAANAIGVGRLMAHCRTAKAWLQCSSAGVYQPAGPSARKESDPLGDSHRGVLPTYSICKIAAETIVRFGAVQWQIPTTIARLSVPYGGNGGWPDFHLQWMMAGSQVPVHPDQPNLFNLIHQDDYIAHIPQLLEIASVPATVVNWGGSTPTSVEEWCTHIADLTGLRASFLATPQTVPSIPIDVSRMHDLIGPTHVDWRDGIRRMIEARHPGLLASR